MILYNIVLHQIIANVDYNIFTIHLAIFNYYLIKFLQIIKYCMLYTIF